MRVASACWEIIRPSRPARSRASRMTSSSSTGLPSSVNPTAPARASAAKSVSTRPMLPTVTAGMANSRTLGPRARSSIHRMVSVESFTGIVFGMATTEVKPPAAAAAVPDAIVSLPVWPGSRR